MGMGADMRPIGMATHALGAHDEGHLRAIFGVDIPCCLKNLTILLSGGRQRLCIQRVAELRGCTHSAQWAYWPSLTPSRNMTILSGSLPVFFAKV